MKMNDRGKEQESQSDNFFLRIIKSRYVTIFSFSRNNKITLIINTITLFSAEMKNTIFYQTKSL